MNTAVIHKIDKDIIVFCVTANSFPEGIRGAHEKLHSMLPAVTGRRFFGISFPDSKGKIIYKAAVGENFHGEAELYNCETFIIRKGEYAGIDIYNYPEQVIAISQAFRQLLSGEDIDPQGYCLEQYLSDKDVRCLVKLK